MQISGSKKIFIFILILFYLFLYCPIIDIIIESFVENGQFSLYWFKAFFSNSILTSSLLNSFAISLISVSLALLLTLSGIFYLFANGNKIILFNLMVLNVIPEIIFAIILLMFYSYFSFELGMISLMIPYIIISMSYIFPIIYYKWKEINPSLIIAAYDLGANSFYIWNTIILQQLKSSILASSFLAFIILFDDYIISYFCGSPSFLTISIPILASLRTGISSEIKALSVFLMLISLIFGTIFLIFTDLKINKINNQEK